MERSRIVKTIGLFLGLLLFQLNCKASEKADTVLVVMNIQQHFTDKCLTTEEEKTFLDKTNKLITSFDRDNVLYVKSVLTTLNLSGKGFKVDTLPGLGFDEKLKVVNADVISKNKANAFKIDEFHDWIRAKEPKCIVIVGFRTTHSIYRTLKGGKKRYTMAFVEGLVKDLPEKSEEDVCQKLTEKGFKKFSTERL